MKKKPIKKVWYAGFILGKTNDRIVGKIRNFFPQVEIWVPKTKILSYKDGQEVIQEVNIFDNYIFLKLPKDDFKTLQEIVRKTPILYFVRSGENPAPITEEEVIHLRSLSRMVMINECLLNVGESVEIIKGAYSGYVGILKSKNREKVIVEINLYDIKTEEVELNLSDIKGVDETGEIKIYPEGEFNIAKDR